MAWGWPAASCCTVSYQAPLMALANFCPEPSGRLSTSLRTTSRSRISPGIFEESKMEGMLLSARICETRGFQVNTAGFEAVLREAGAIAGVEGLIGGGFCAGALSTC